MEAALDPELETAVLSPAMMEEDDYETTVAEPAEIGKSFVCRFPKCGKQYASTDACRKHSRKRHPEWLMAFGQDTESTGLPNLAKF